LTNFILYANIVARNRKENAMKVIAIFSVRSDDLLKVVGPFSSDSDVSHYLRMHEFTERRTGVAGVEGLYLSTSFTEKALVMPLEAP